MNSAKWRFGVDAGMGAALLVAVSSGLVLGMGTPAGADAALRSHSTHVWGALHGLSSAVLLLGTLVHLAIHRRWIAGAVRSMKVRGIPWIEGGLLVLFLGVLATAPEGAHGASSPQDSPVFLLHWAGALALAGLALAHLAGHRAWIASVLRLRPGQED